MPETAIDAAPVVTDALWARIQPLLPAKPRRRQYPGRFPLHDRAVLNGILYILATGIGFERLPMELGYGSGMTCWRRVREWQTAGLWDAIVAFTRAELPEVDIDFGRVATRIEVAR